MTQIVYQLINEDFERTASAAPLNAPRIKPVCVEVLDTGGPRYVLINGQPIGGVLDLEMPGDRPGPQVRITLLAKKVTMRQATREECEALAAGDRGASLLLDQPGWLCVDGDTGQRIERVLAVEPNKVRLFVDTSEWSSLGVPVSCLCVTYAKCAVDERARTVTFYGKRG